MTSELRLFDRNRFRYFKKEHRRLDLECVYKSIRGGGVFEATSTSEHFSIKFKNNNKGKELWIDDDGRIIMD